MEPSEVWVVVRGRTCGIVAVAILAVLVSTAVPAHAETIPAPEPTHELDDQPALPAGEIPPIEPSIPEGDLDPGPTGPIPTAGPIVVPTAPVGTAVFDPNRPGENAVYSPRWRGGTTTSGGAEGGTESDVPQDLGSAPQDVEPEDERAQSATPSPSPDIATASPSPDTAITPSFRDDASEGSVEPGAAVPSTAAQRGTAPAVPSLILGILLLAVGAVLMTYRVRLDEATVGARKRWFTTGLGARAERLASPRWGGVAGGCSALLGAVLIGFAVWQFSI